MVSEVKNVEIVEIKSGSIPTVKITGIKNFDIEKIFDCGQCFRFDRVENSAHGVEFSGVAYGRFVSFAQDRDAVYIYGSTREEFDSIWKRYLDIERDYDGVGEDILSHCDTEAMRSAIDYSRGIRILAQDPFECVISFIVSQNNNIPRIKKIIEALCLKCGTPIEISAEMREHLSGKSSLCAFPDASALAALGEDGLFELKTGFRAKYIYDAVTRCLDGRLNVDSIIAANDTESAISALCEVKGIGRKVASCALLFGFCRYDAFPVDVWIKRVGDKYFGDEGKEISGERFGAYAGIAQQYLFYYERYRSLEGE